MKSKQMQCAADDAEAFLKDGPSELDTDKTQCLWGVYRDEREEGTE